MKSAFSLEPIKNLVLPIEKWDPGKSEENKQIQYIDIASVDRELKSIESPQVVFSHEAPSRARQKVKSGDVLISTVRPNLNAVALVSDSLKDATASTGYCVLRCKSLLDERFLFYWVRSTYFIDDMVSQATGASYPAVSDKVIKESKIPLPPPRNPTPHRRRPRKSRPPAQLAPSGSRAAGRSGAVRVLGDVWGPGDKPDGVGNTGFRRFNQRF